MHLPTFYSNPAFHKPHFHAAFNRIWKDEFSPHPLDSLTKEFNFILYTLSSWKQNISLWCTENHISLLFSLKFPFLVKASASQRRSVRALTTQRENTSHRPTNVLFTARKRMQTNAHTQPHGFPFIDTRRQCVVFLTGLYARRRQAAHVTLDGGPGAGPI